ncbi:ASCH domain-containing protein [Paracoccus onubensis]|uniref:ASCH domain-containing protein n=1 Tax=Paracoccus onubensis TaxID=1675788 RepID=UPI001E305D41|nr:ASCH domain-containing protein [Paracoccus onubensis]
MSFTFGDSRELCDRLLALVRSGKKTASCGALRDFTEGGEELPEVGRRDTALDWDGNPALLIETTEVSIRRFREVTEDFALAEGEGDFDAWTAGHIDYFSRNGGFDPDMELVCERFRLIEVLSCAVS